MKSEWDVIIKNIQDFQISLEDLLEMLPFGKKYFKSKQKIEKQWRELGRALDSLDPYITNLIDSIPIDNPWNNKDFINTWNYYKDYLYEQHGFRMKSRMEQQRLEWLVTNTGNDYKKAIAWLKFYIARGSEGLFIVKNENSDDGTVSKEQKRAEFTLPKK